jgi:hypothetical protein
MARSNVSIETLRRILRYEPETGKLFWLPRPLDLFTDGKHTAEHTCAKWNSKNAGKEAFTALNDGRPHGRIFRKPYFASRVAWALTHGYWPVEIDHRDHNPANNRIGNLRACTHKQNLRNQSPMKGGSSRFLGVSWDASRRKWAAGIKPDGKRVSLGRHASEEAAARAYDAAAREYFGEFANLNFPDERANQ